jgi:hypothetical protein
MDRPVGDTRAVEPLGLRCDESDADASGHQRDDRLGGKGFHRDLETEAGLLTQQQDPVVEVRRDLARKYHHLLAFQVAERQRLARGQWMANGQHDMERRRTDLLHRQTRIVQRRVNQTHVEVPAPQCVFLFGRRHLTHLQPDVG